MRVIEDGGENDGGGVARGTGFVDTRDVVVGRERTVASHPRLPIQGATGDDELPLPGRCCVVGQGLVKLGHIRFSVAVVSAYNWEGGRDVWGGGEGGVGGGGLVPIVETVRLVPTHRGRSVDIEYTHTHTHTPGTLELGASPARSLMAPTTRKYVGK